MSRALWQRCPVCDGTGCVSRPPGLAADQRTFPSSSTGPWPCPTCEGARIIREPDNCLQWPPIPGHWPAGSVGDGMRLHPSDDEDDEPITPDRSPAA